MIKEKIKTCDCCKKEFSTNAFVKPYKAIKDKTVYYCCYTCYRAAGYDTGKSDNHHKKAQNQPISSL